MARNGWSAWHLFGAAALLVVGLLATGDVWRGIWETTWRHSEVEPALLAPLVACWLLWVRRERLRLCEPVGTWIGPVIVGLSWVLGLVGDQTGTQVLVHFSGLGIVVGCILSVLGLDVLRLFFPVFVALLMLIPTPWWIHAHVTQRLMVEVTELGVLLYGALGLEVERSGQWLLMGDALVPIIPACGAAGLKTTFLIAFGLAFGQPLKTWVRMLILAITPVAAFFCQIAGTLLAVWVVRFLLDGRLVDQVAGWIVLPVVFVVLMGLVKLLSWASVPVQYYTLAQDR